MRISALLDRGHESVRTRTLDRTDPAVVRVAGPTAEHAAADALDLHDAIARSAGVRSTSFGRTTTVCFLSFQTSSRLMVARIVTWSPASTS